MLLRKAAGVQLAKRGVWLFAEYRCQYSRSGAFRLRASQYAEARARVADGGAARIGEVAERALWWTSEGFFWADPALDVEAVELLVWDRRRRHEGRLHRLRQLREREQESAERRRARISEAVRLAVWARDEGRCVRCSADEDLQFDHVIPVSRGGGSSAENVQVLCGDCNRLKADAIA